MPTCIIITSSTTDAAAETGSANPQWYEKEGLLIRGVDGKPLNRGRELWGRVCSYRQTDIRLWNSYNIPMLPAGSMVSGSPQSATGSNLSSTLCKAISYKLRATQSSSIITAAFDDVNVVQF